MERQNRSYQPRPKECIFCKRKITQIDYNDVDLLRRYLSSWAKIKPAKATGTCSRHQRQLSRAVKTGRQMGLLPFTRR